MAKPIRATVIPIAQTRVDLHALDKMIRAIGSKPWTTDVPPGADMLTEVAGKLCYMAFDEELNENLTRVGGKTNGEYIRKSILDNGHGSVLEHSSVTFAMLNVSRVFTHEIVRHRAGTAFSQVSGRYVRTDVINYYLPTAIMETRLADAFHNAFVSMERRHAQLVDMCKLNEITDFKLKKILTSAFRRIIGNGQLNHIVVTANHRAWRHMIALRTAPEAEEEIREVFTQVFFDLQQIAPNIYADAVVEDDPSSNPFIKNIRFANEKV